MRLSAEKDLLGPVSRLAGGFFAGLYFLVPSSGSPWLKYYFIVF